MTPECFVAELRERIFPGVIDGIEAIHLSPPGRKPDPELVTRSEGFLAWSEKDRVLALKIAENAADLAIYSFLTMLDGPGVGSHEVPPGKFVLEYRNGDERVVLADSDEVTDLHQWFKMKR